MLRRFDDLVERHQHRIFGFAAYYLGNSDDARDATQEVLLRLWNNIERVEPDCAGAWLTRVTRNVCFDSLRSRRARRKVFDDGCDAAETEVADSTADPHQSAENTDLDRRLRRALATLEDPYRSIAILREIEDRSYQEIADAMDLPLNTVKTYLHRARRRLREELSEVRYHARTA